MTKQKISVEKLGRKTVAIEILVRSDGGNNKRQMERRVAVHIVLICVFGQIHSVTLKIERYSAEDSVGASVSFGKTNKQVKAVEIESRTYGYFCLKHTEQAKINYSFSAENRMDLKVYFKIDANKYRLRKIHEHDLNIKENRAACFIFGTWFFEKRNANDKIEIYLTYLSDVYSIDDRQLLFLKLNLDEGTVKSYMYIYKSTAFKDDSESVQLAAKSIKDKITRNFYDEYKNKKQFIIGHVRASYDMTIPVNFSIDSNKFSRSEEGVLYMLFYKDYLDRVEDDKAVISFLNNYSYSNYDNYLASLECNKNGIFFSSKYKLPKTDEPETYKSLVSDVEEDEAANIANGFKQHI